ncbi:hypothetical protein [Streptomyces sp. CoH17]|uniref:hypothetical protein n=1 Tax=Streptomyces sp. CoH17 TaxID=2992806 RepID=UPI00226D591A|nr:hypothetical protein [Streptomyces sp. CoH17]
MTEKEDRSKLEATVKPDKAEITQFKLELHLGGTVTVSSLSGQHWIKPGVTSGLTWDGIPEESELKAAVQLLLKGALGPVMDDIVKLIHERIK